MYTGIAESTGRVVAVEDVGEGRRIDIAAADVFDGMVVGDSVAVSGVCLTAERVLDGKITCFVGAETLERSWFDELEAGDRLNLERPLRPTDEIGGHVVEGHVEASATILERRERERGCDCRIALPTELAPSVVEKGYVAVDGLSLTVAAVTAEAFEVSLIPETLSVSNLSERGVGDPVNLETDPIARYVERLAAAEGSELAGFMGATGR